MTENMEHILHTAKEAAHAAGQLLIKSFGQLNRDQIGLKGMGDYVTDLDCQSESMIIQIIKKTFH